MATETTIAVLRGDAPANRSVILLLGVAIFAALPTPLAEFTTPNDSYRARFGFPFILAVKGRCKSDILTKACLGNETAAEFEEALHQVERIALLRLKERLS
jgi:2-oxo-4-hydroxy-4-carboxy--5-ureidoimidazoline (OHCU) decarboxylase